MSQDEMNDGPSSLVEMIQEVHDYVSTTAPSTKESIVDTEEWAQINYYLVILRKAFERMKEVSA